MSLVSQIISSSDNELRYPSVGELADLKNYFATGEQRILISCILRDKEQLIIQDASKAIFKLHPEYIAPGGNAEGARRRSLCLRDYGWYLRLVTYGIICGDKNVIESIGLIGVKEMYNSLGVPLIGMVDAIGCLKSSTKTILTQEQFNIASPYFDFIVQGMS